MNEINKGNVARYCKPSSLGEDGCPTSSAFQRRPNRNEGYLSVYLLEFFKNKNTDEKENVAEVKKEMEKHSNFDLKKNGLFAVINIEQSKDYILKEIQKLISYRELRLPHCGIFHDHDDLVISELLVECIQSQYKIKDIE